MTGAKQPTDRLAGKKNPVIRTAYIINDHEVAEQLADAEYREGLLVLQLGADPGNEDLRTKHAETEATVASLREQIKNSSLRFVFRSIGRDRFDKLVAEHPMTDEIRQDILGQIQRENPGQEVNADALPSYNPYTLAPALCKAALVSPVEATDDIVGYWDDPDWNSAELASLFSAALDANTTRRILRSGNV